MARYYTLCWHCVVDTDVPASRLKKGVVAADPVRPYLPIAVCQRYVPGLSKLVSPCCVYFRARRDARAAPLHSNVRFHI